MNSSEENKAYLDVIRDAQAKQRKADDERFFTDANPWNKGITLNTGAVERIKKAADRILGKSIVSSGAVKRAQRKRNMEVSALADDMARGFDVRSSKGQFFKVWSGEYDNE